MFDEEELDKELEAIKNNNEEGLVKIARAKELLPIHYKNLIDIVGEIGDTIDTDRLPSTIRETVELLNEEAPFLGTLANTLVVSLVYADLYGKFRPYIQDSVVSKKSLIPTNLLGINISNSGSGKDASFNLGEEVTKKANKKIIESILVDMEKKAKIDAIAVSNEKQKKDGVEDKDIVEDDSGWMQLMSPLPTYMIKMATYEAYLAELEQIEKSSDRGNLFIKISELGSSLKLDPNIDKLIMIQAEGYDEGKISEDLKKTKELKTGSIGAVGTSMLAHTSPAPLLGDQKLVEKFKTIISTYLGRRSYITFTSLSEATSTIKLVEDLDKFVDNSIEHIHDSVISMTKLENKAIEGVSRLLNGTDLNKITLTGGAKKLYRKYFFINKYYRNLAYMKSEDFATDGLLTELINRHWKAIKLAGLWALTENTSVIDAKMLASAIYFTELTGKGLRKVLNMIDLEDHERFIEYLKESVDVQTIRFDTLIKQKYITRATKQQIDAFLVAVNSALQGKAVIIADYVKSRLEVNRVKQADKDYKFSYINFKPTDSKEYRAKRAYKDFKHYHTDLKGLTKLLSADTAYCAFKFKDGYRKDENILDTTNYVVLDVDSSELAFDILHETYLSQTLHIIATTSDPNNKMKFRIILPIQQQIGDNKHIYKYVVQRLADELMLTVDVLGRSQIYFSYSTSTVLNNIDSELEPMDIGDILKDASTEVQIPRYDTPLTKAQQKKVQEALLYDFETELGFAIYAPVGRRSICLYAAGKKIQQAGCDHRTITLLLNKINSNRVQSMPQDRLNRIIGQFK